MYTYFSTAFSHACLKSDDQVCVPSRSDSSSLRKQYLTSCEESNLPSTRMVHSIESNISRLLLMPQPNIVERPPGADVSFKSSPQSSIPPPQKHPAPRAQKRPQTRAAVVHKNFDRRYDRIKICNSLRVCHT